MIQPPDRNPRFEHKDELAGHQSWPVTFMPDGAIMGLPEGVAPCDVIVFLDADGKWYAGKPSSELLAEKKLWRTDWQD